MISNNADIYLNLSNNLKYSDSVIYGGNKKFFENYVIPEKEKTTDEINNLSENKIANATLKAVSDGLTLSKIPIYADKEGFIGTNGKKLRQNFRKIKNYFFSHRKY